MNIKKLLDTIRMETDEIYWNLIEELKSLGLNPEDEFDDWIYVDNNSPIMLVAHIDTITRNNKLKFRVKRDRIRARNSVLGADDRAGIYAIMEILRMCKEQNVPMPSILFTNYEESGLLGVQSFIDAKKMKRNMNIFIELDRRGKDEYVYYFTGMPAPVRNWVESFGFIEDFGSMSDVMSLTEEYNIPHVNLSVGYYDQHTTREMLRPSELQLTIDRVFNMILDPLEQLYEVDGKAYDPYNDYCGYGYGITRNRYDSGGWKASNIVEQEDNKIITKAYMYNNFLDTLEEIDYEVESSDIPWDDNMENMIEVMEDELSVDKEKSIHGMTDEDYYNHYGWIY